VNKPSVVAQAVDFLPGAVDAEFAVLCDEGSAPEIKRSEAVVVANALFSLLKLLIYEPYLLCLSRLEFQA
jgi:hypothetical protein